MEARLENSVVPKIIMLVGLVLQVAGLFGAPVPLLRNPFWTGLA
jgi:hypothetical protein